MAGARSRGTNSLTPLHYELAARAVIWNELRARRRIPPAHARQRKITLASLELVRPHRPDFQVFGDPLVLYQEAATGKIDGVEPDDMIVLHEADLGPRESYNVPHMPARPFWVMHYVTRPSEEGDRDESFEAYERDLTVPYYLIFSLPKRKQTLYRLNEKSRRYQTVSPNAEGRFPVPEVGIEVGLIDGWTRFWFQGRLLLLPAELDRELTRERQRADDAVSRAERLAAQLRALGIDPEA